MGVGAPRLLLVELHCRGLTVDDGAIFIMVGELAIIEEPHPGVVLDGGLLIDLIEAPHAGDVGHWLEHVALAAVQGAIQLGLADLPSGLLEALDLLLRSLGWKIAARDRVLIQRLVVDADLGTVGRHPLLAEL